MEKKKNSYHDYVIKDGKFIGDFENMYQDCKDPWMQSQQPNKYSRISGIWHLKNFGITSVLECGCGLGYYSDWIHKETRIIPRGVDISQEAITQAKKRFPHLDFAVSDITTELDKHTDVECILLSEIIWYILPDLDKLITAMKTHFAGKYLLVNQVFYKGSQRYGNDYFTSLEEFIEYIPFALLGKAEATLKQDSTIETSSIFEIA